MSFLQLRLLIVFLVSILHDAQARKGSVSSPTVVVNRMSSSARSNHKKGKKGFIQSKVAKSSRKKGLTANSCEEEEQGEVDDDREGYELDTPVEDDDNDDSDIAVDDEMESNQYSEEKMSLGLHVDSDEEYDEDDEEEEEDGDRYAKEEPYRGKQKSSASSKTPYSSSSSSARSNANRLKNEPSSRSRDQKQRLERDPRAVGGRSNRPKEGPGIAPNNNRQGKSSRSKNMSSSSSNRRVVPYTRQPQPSAAALAFTRGITALRESIPDPAALRETALSSIQAARETTSKLSANIYREVKGLTSSELEQVMLKATRPDDSTAKGKHVERLVGVTYQISARYDIYDAVLRKLWSKMCEKDWRTTIKSLYVLHRFSADGAPDHQPALKARLRELRRTKDPKRKEKYFNSKLILAGDTSPAIVPFRAFLARYAHYVLLRAQCFGGMFNEIAEELTPSPTVSSESSAKSKSKKTASTPSSPSPKQQPFTSTSLRTEHLDAAKMLLKAGVACTLQDDEECENTAVCVERVVSDLMELTAAVAKALNRALAENTSVSEDAALLKRWCEFYSEELLPSTKAMMKKTSPRLDTYGLFLPSRMKTSMSQDLLLKGLKGAEVLETTSSVATESSSHVEKKVEVKETTMVGEKKTKKKATNDRIDLGKESPPEEENHEYEDREEENGEESEEKKEVEEEVDSQERESSSGNTMSKEEGDPYEYYDEDEYYEEEGDE